jgi:GNAT superfamily N-acetyltransferase
VTSLTILPLTPERWRDFTALFGPRGACAGCWCTWARLTHAEFRAATPERRRAHIRRVVTAGVPPGLLAYDGDRAVGWVALAPRATYRRFESSRVLAPVDATPVWSVPCFFVASTHRRRGLTVALLKAACAFAARHGARIVEGYPVDTHGKRQAAAFVWTGLPGAFEAAGFREVARRSPTRPIMRRTVRARKAVTRG